MRNKMALGDAIIHWIPLVRDLRHFHPEWLSRDLIAGLSVTAVQIPTAIAYANLAGFPPEVGLYASLLPVLVYAPCLAPRANWCGGRTPPPAP